MTIRRQTGQVQYGGIRASWPALPRGYVDGLILTRDAGDTDHDINVAAGVCRDSTNTVNMEVDDITKRIDAAWAVGDDAGGLFTGAVAADTWYHFFIISNGGVIDAGYDTSVTAANRPAAYTYYRRVGSVRTLAGAATLTAFSQRGDRFIYAAGIVDYDNTDGDDYTGGVVITLHYVPLGIETVGLLRCGVEGQSTGDGGLLTPTLETAGNPATNAAPLMNLGGTGGEFGLDMEIDVDAAAHVDYDQLTDAGTKLFIIVRGWIDTRGKNA